MKLLKLYERYKDVIPYLFFGGCTTAVNVIVYWIMAYPVGSTVMISTVVAWLFAVLFAYFTNRKWVFCSVADGAKAILKEMGAFFACRLATGVIDWGWMFFFVDVLQLNDVCFKFLANVVVIILNYIASKKIIFKRKKNNS